MLYGDETVNNSLLYGDETVSNMILENNEEQRRTEQQQTANKQEQKHSHEEHEHEQEEEEKTHEEQKQKHEHSNNHFPNNKTKKYFMLKAMNSKFLAHSFENRTWNTLTSIKQNIRNELSFSNEVYGLVVINGTRHFHGYCLIENDNEEYQQMNEEEAKLKVCCGSCCSFCSCSSCSC